MPSCQQQADQRSTTAQYIVFGSVALTFVMMIMMQMGIKRIIQQQNTQLWKKLSTICVIFAIIKLGVAVTLFLFPYCPSACSYCVLSSYNNLYPCVCIGLAVSWVVRARRFWKLAANGPANAALTDFHRALNDGGTRRNELSQPLAEVNTEPVVVDSVLVQPAPLDKV